MGIWVVRNVFVYFLKVGSALSISHIWEKKNVKFRAGSNIATKKKQQPRCSQRFGHCFFPGFSRRETQSWVGCLDIHWLQVSKWTFKNTPPISKFFYQIICVYVKYIYIYTYYIYMYLFQSSENNSSYEFRSTPSVALPDCFFAPRKTWLFPALERSPANGCNRSHLVKWLEICLEKNEVFGSFWEDCQNKTTGLCHWLLSLGGKAVDLTAILGNSKFQQPGCAWNRAIWMVPSVFLGDVWWRNSQRMVM